MGNDVPTTITMNEVEFFAHRYTQEIGCWNWTGNKDIEGYGKMSVKRLGKWREVRVHRLSHFLHTGKLNKNLVVDHLCGNKSCVNPRHLEQVSAKENTSRWNATRTHCKHGHEFTAENSYSPPKHPEHKHCRTCQKENEKRYRGKNPAS